MDDGIELNFAPSSAGGSSRQVSRKKSGGNWTERLKANKAAKQRSTGKPSGSSLIKKALPLSLPSNAQGRPALTVAAPRPVASIAQAETQRRDATTSVVRAPDPVQAPNVPQQAKEILSSYSSTATARPTNFRTEPSKSSSQASPRPRPSQSQNTTNSSGPATSHQVISSLFSSNPTISRPPKSSLTEEDERMPNALNPSNAPIDTSTFQGLGLDPLLTYHLQTKLKILRPTRIQRSALPDLLDPTPLTLGIPASTAYSPETYPVSRTAQTHRDAFIQSQTGSGKTLSYLLPIVQSLLPLASRKGQFIDRSVGTLAIVLAPTRELARQISEVVDDLLRMGMSMPVEGTKMEDEIKKEEGNATEPKEQESRGPPIYHRYLVSGLLTGGSTRTHEKSRLRRGCPILVCTPGRLLDHLQNTQSFKVDKLMWLVLDEADRLVEEGFGETLNGIMRALDGRRKIGMEAEREGDEVDRRKAARGTRNPNLVTMGESRVKVKIEGFDEESESEDDDDDDEWDYETMGAKPKASKTAKSPKEEPSQHTVPLPRSTNTLSTSSSSWPYWHMGRRTILCSATVSGEVQKLAGTTLKNPIMFRGSDVKDGISADDEADGEGLIIQTRKPKSTVTKSAEESKSDEKDDIGEDEKFTPPSQLDQRYVVVPPKLRLVTLVALLRSLIAKATAAAAATGTTGSKAPGMKVIVFMSCTDSVDFHWRMFGGVSMNPAGGEAGSGSGPKEEEEGEQDRIGYACPLLPSTSIFRLHGSLPLATRRASLSAFAASSQSKLPADLVNNAHSILLCTSVASRGLDLPLVRAVVQYDLPTEQGVNEYVHRVGRTARVGKGGESWAFVGDKEVGWVDWVEEGMNKSGASEGASTASKPQPKKKKGEDGDVSLRQVGVEEVLKRGFVPKGGMKYDREYEGRATQVQLAFERWVLENDANAEIARRAFSSSVRAYSTHPSEEKQFFHVKNLHLGHMAKAFGLRETPGKIGGGAPKQPAAGKAAVKDRSISGGNKTMLKRSRANDSDEEDDPSAHAQAEKKAKIRGSEAALTDVEKRMYEAVRRQGRLTKSGGVMGMSVGGGGTGRRAQADGGEFQVAGTGELEKMVKRKF